MNALLSSLRARLVIAFAILTLILTTLLSLAIDTATTREAKQQIGNRLEETATEMQDKLDQGMFERYREIENLATLLSNNQDNSELHVRRAFLNEIQRTYKNFAWIGLADTEGRVVIATQGLLEGKSVRSRPWWEDGLRGPYVGDLHEGKLLNGLVAPAGVGPLRLVDIAFPVKDQQGQAIGVLGAHLSWAWAAEVRQSVIQPTMERDGLETLVLDASNKVILGPPSLLGRQLMVKTTAHKGNYRTELFPDGQVWLTAYARTQGYKSFPGLGWQIIVRQRAQDALAPIRLMHEQIIGWGLLIGCLFMLMGVACANWLARPILRLSDAVDARRTRPDAPFPVITSYREVKQLSQALNAFVATQQATAAELANSNALLEQRVLLRTEELQRSEAIQVRQTQLLHMILNNMSEGVIAVDRNSQPILVNQAATSLTDLIPIEQWLSNGLPAFGFFETDMETRYTPEQLPLVRALNGETVDRAEVVLKHPAWQEPVWLQVHARPLMDAGDISYGAILVFSNISRQKAVEQMKNEFVSVVSHELRTPLTSIHGTLGLMHGGLVGELPAQAKPLLDIALNNSDRLIRLINDILDVQKLDAGRLNMRLQRLDMRQLAEQAVASVSGLEERYHIHFAFRSDLADAWVQADSDRLIQAFVNLLSNGAKFSPAEKAVEVALERHGSGYRFSVTDTGPGIPAEFRSRIFERFAQANARDTRSKDGTGLGLNITRSLIERMGGSIGFESEPHVRTVFFIDMPVAQGVDISE